MAYVIMPVLAGAALVGVSEQTVDGLGVAAAGVIATIPAGVHMYHGNSEHALISYGSMVGVTLLSTAAFGGLGYYVGKASCDPDAPENEAEGCSFSIIGYTVLGAAAGAIVGYVGYAVYDVSSNSRVVEPADRDDAALGVWINPLTSASTEQSQAPKVNGLLLGATLVF